MQVAELNERIKVRADFSPGGKIVPILFKRRGEEALRVRSVHASWEDRESNGKRLYFSVSVDRADDVFQLRYQEHDRTWWLESVTTEG